jgi:hypothetical protein
LAQVIADNSSIMPSWLETLKQKQRRAADLREELAQLEAELRDAKAILSGREPAQPSLLAGDKPKSRHGFVGGKRSKPIQQGSSVFLAEQILQERGEPMPIDSILDAIYHLTGQRVLKSTLVSNLSRYVKHGDTFTRPAPSVYGLTAFERKDGVVG